MDISTVKIDLIHWLAEINDVKLLEKLQTLKKEQEESFELDATQQNELDRRLNKYEAGEMKFTSWEAAKERIREKSKNAL